MKWMRRVAWGVGAVLGLWALAWLAVPPILKSQAQSRLGERLGRPVTVGAVDFQPWSLKLTVTDLVVGAAPAASAAAEAPAGAPAAAEAPLQVGRIFVDADIASVFRAAPVVEALEVDGLRVRVARTAEGHYDIDDLIARFAPAAEPAAPAGEPARFALHNLQLRDAQLRFDDRPVQRVHTVDALTLTLPFVSNLPSEVEIKVEPRLAFRLNGTPFDTGAQATPFAQTRQGELKLAFDDLDVAPYLGYLPESLPVRLRAARLGSDLVLRFVAPPGGDATLVVQGRVGAKGLALADAAGAPLLSWDALSLELRDVQPLARRLGFGTLAVDGATLHASRDAQGALNLARLAGPPAAPAGADARPAAASAAASGASGAGPAGSPAPGWAVSLDALRLEGARVLWNDAAVSPPAALQLDGIAFGMKQLQWPVAQPMPLTLAATLRAQGEGAPARGTLAIEGQATDQAAQASIRLEGLSLDALGPYVAQALVPRLDGTLALAGQLEWSGAAEAPKLALRLDRATLDALRLIEPGARADAPAVALKQLALDDVQVDLPGRRVVLGSVRLAQPELALSRDAQGVLNATRWTVTPAASPATPPTPAAPSRGAKPAPQEAPWALQLKDLSLEGGRLRLVDAAATGLADKPLRVELGALRVKLQELAWPGTPGAAPTRLQLAARVGTPATPREKAGPAGVLDWNGRLGLAPLRASGTLRVERFPVHLFEPYFGANLPVSLLHADAGWKGELTVQQGAGGWGVNAAGEVLVSDVAVNTRAASRSAADLAGTDELLSWKALRLAGVKVALAPPGRPRVEIGEAVLADFYSRLVITEQGRFNLQDVAAPGAAASAPAGAASAAAPAGAVAVARGPAAAASAPGGAPAGGELPLDLVVGGTRLVNGRVDFTDRFVRPNYSAALSELNGQLGAFRSGTREMATLELRGRAAGTALLEIVGQLNPTAQPLALDIRAKATDLELAPFSPYAGKYAGYAIERGKLSMDVAYKIDADGKLDAKNQVVLNQLTFGDKVESPEATKLPVLLAVALLKDRNGVIDINLPISGSINDPQFSVGGLIVKVIVNLLVKAITAPFSLLFGGGGSDDLSFVEFRPGTARVAESGVAALDKVAKALQDRTSLKMTVTGAADPATEADAWRQAALEARLLAERKSERVREGAATEAEVQLSPEDRARLLKEVYRRTDLPNKPRNALGMQRDIPGPEMEKLLKARLPVGPEAMRELALQRGIAVRDALIERGLGSERLFLAAPKMRGEAEATAAAGAPGGAASAPAGAASASASGGDGGPWTPRVLLTLSAN